MQTAPHQYLTYCTNIHPANGWAAVLENLKCYALPLKAALAPDVPFGLGLRLSGDESREVLTGDHLPRFADFLEEHGLRVCLINGFPHGPFHRQAVKDQVHAPDWRTSERVAYTKRLVRVLTHLLPGGIDGGISTNPLSYRPWFSGEPDEATWELLTRHVVDVAEDLVVAHRTSGKTIHLDLEPEPDGLLDNSADLVHFFQEWLLPVGAPMLARSLGVSREEAEELLLAHVRVCWDTCHAAVAYEEPTDVLARYERAGIQVGRVQISSALDVTLPPNPDVRHRLAAALAPFAESTYLHQVTQKNHDGSLHAFTDLDEALPAIDDPAAAAWRIHFHVPIFAQNFGVFGSTQSGIVQTLELLHERPFTQHLEIETYTWDVLPEPLRLPLAESTRREFEWVLGVLASLPRHA